MPKFHFGYMPPGGSGDIFIEMFVGRNRTQSFTKPCEISLVNFGTCKRPIHIAYEPYVLEAEQQFGYFRSIDWSKVPTALDHLIKKYAKSDGIWFATYLQDIFVQVKQHWQDQVRSISINYDIKDYDLVLQKWAEWQATLVLTRDKYRSLHVNPNKAIDFCKTNQLIVADYIIPKESYVPADVEINFKDIYNEHSLKEIISNLGGYCNEQDWEFYREFINQG